MNLSACSLICPGFDQDSCPLDLLSKVLIIQDFVVLSSLDDCVSQAFVREAFTELCVFVVSETSRIHESPPTREGRTDH